MRTSAVEQFFVGMVILRYSIALQKCVRPRLIFLYCSGDEGTSIVDGIVQVLKKAPLDVKAAMLENLLLVGGAAMIPGKLDVQSKFCYFCKANV